MNECNNVNFTPAAASVAPKSILLIFFFYRLSFSKKKKGKENYNKMRINIHTAMYVWNISFILCFCYKYIKKLQKNPYQNSSVHTNL